jgi:ABC-type transport system involved in cytochrome bd biosynthesis fused ATPase/permease subunit
MSPEYVSGESDYVRRTPAAMDLEEALSLCEQLLREVDRGRRQIALARTLWIGVVAVVILAVVMFGVGSHDSASGWAVASAAAAAAVIVITLMAQWLIVQMREQVNRDELVMVDLIGMQREIWPLLARREKWSQARNYLTEKRLEQFPIEAESIPDRPSRFGS